MSRIAPWFCADIIVGLVLVALSGDRLKSQPIGFSASSDHESCAIAGSAFVCVADLDGNGLKQVIVGQIDAYSPCTQNCSTGTVYMSYANIINNTGAVRQQVCWLGQNASPGTGIAVCPPITSSANAR
jgi:hypothetical protein